MKERILRELETEYQAQRVANQAEEARRLDRASAADPQIRALVDRRQALFRERMAAAFAAPGQAMRISEGLTRSLEVLAAELRKRLKAAGFPEDYLQPVYRCPKCRDYGYVGEPLREMCDCLRGRVAALILQNEAMGIQAGECFECWDATIFDPDPLPDLPQGQRRYMLRVRELCEAYADAFPQTAQRDLLFSGSSGLGKTYLLNCIAQRVLSRGYSVWKLTAHRLMALLRDEAFGRGDPEQQRLLWEVPLLLVDDLGTEPMLENVTIPQLFRLLNERACAGRHTIVSTNLTLHQLLERYTERIGSRLMDARTTGSIRFLGKDVRRAGK